MNVISCEEFIDTQTQRFKEPDEDFYRAITMDEFKIRARGVVKNAYNRYINERNN